MRKETADVERGAGVFASIITSLVVKVRERGGDGANFHFLVKPEAESTLDQIAELIVRAGRPTNSFCLDKRKDGWTLLENVQRRLTSANIDVVSFLNGNENYINGEEMVRRARMELDANYGQEDAEWLFENLGAGIPFELRKFYLVFPGTVWQDTGGGRLVPCLRWGDGQGQWIFGFLRLDDVFWLSSGRLIIPRK